MGWSASGKERIDVSGTGSYPQIKRMSIDAKGVHSDFDGFSQSVESAKSVDSSKG
jgi:hypothetical protein